jgi:GNAT superfamily N-acetyltransferase
MRGFATYPEWAPDWRPPADLAAAQHAGWSRSLLEPERWTVVVEDGADVVAVVSFAQARSAPMGMGEPVPGVAHVGALFVDRAWWGRGVAPALLARATEEMAARGYERGRLIVPERHARARALYARAGWETVGPWSDDRLGLPLLELGKRLRRG